jgi:hypothetical protein
MEAAKMAAMHLSTSAQALLAPRLTAAFMDGFHRGCQVAAGTAVVVAVIVFYYLPAGTSSAKSELVFED